MQRVRICVIARRSNPASAPSEFSPCITYRTTPKPLSAISTRRYTFTVLKASGFLSHTQTPVKQEATASTITSRLPEPRDFEYEPAKKSGWMMRVRGRTRTANQRLPPDPVAATLATRRGRLACKNMRFADLRLRPLEKLLLDGQQSED